MKFSFHHWHWKSVIDMTVYQESEALKVSNMYNEIFSSHILWVVGIQKFDDKPLKTESFLLQILHPIQKLKVLRIRQNSTRYYKYCYCYRGCSVSRSWESKAAQLMQKYVRWIKDSSMSNDKSKIPSLANHRVELPKNSKAISVFSMLHAQTREAPQKDKCR